MTATAWKPNAMTAPPRDSSSPQAELAPPAAGMGRASLVFGGAAILTAGLWALGAEYLGHGGGPLGTAAAGLLLALAAVTAYTDISDRRIPNWATYTTFLLALVLNALSLAAAPEWLGAVGLGASLLGGFGLFLIMLVVFSITGGGAGDVKFAACLGALFGLRTGLDALIMGYVIGAAVMGAIAIVKYGPLRLLRTAYRTIGFRLAPQWVRPPEAEDRRLMLTQVPLGPFFAAGAFLSLYRQAGEGYGLFF